MEVDAYECEKINNCVVEFVFIHQKIAVLRAKNTRFTLLLRCYYRKKLLYNIEEFTTKS